jgi:hypothetical protein
MKNILVMNDEAHHCYREKPKDADDEDLKSDERKEAEKNNEAARLWISGLEAVNRKLGLSRVIDLSATPFFLQGSGYAEGTLFPWTMSDFSLMDAIECGIVKLPRVPVAENIPGDEMPMFRDLWENIRKDMPKKVFMISSRAFIAKTMMAPRRWRTDAFHGFVILTKPPATLSRVQQLGGSIRCVVSVSMLTEGWDANTVTHVLGIRAFGTQLLCEQVIGRALRRQSYDLNEEGLFNVEYADVFGIPFDFTAKPVIAPPQPPRETVQVKAMRPERDALEIHSPVWKAIAWNCPRNG